MITDERLREIEWATTYVTTHEAPRGCRCGGSCRRCDEWRQQAAKIPPETVLELVAEVRRVADERSQFARQTAQAVEDALRAQRALTWIEGYLVGPVALCCYHAPPAHAATGHALVARALAETAEASS